jgi:hypothetical protein
MYFYLHLLLDQSLYKRLLKLLRYVYSNKIRHGHHCLLWYKIHYCVLAFCTVSFATASLVGNKKKVKQCRYRPGVAQSVPGGQGSQTAWQRHRMVVRLSALLTGRLYPQEIHLVLISARGWVDPRAVVWPAGLCHWKIPITPSGIEPATCRFVA